MILPIVALQGNRVIQQDPLGVAGRDGKDPHFEQVGADLFEDCRVPHRADDGAVDLVGPLSLDHFPFHQVSRCDVHRKTAHGGPRRQVEHKGPLFLREMGVVERLVELHQGQRGMEHDVGMVPGDVQTDG